MSILIIAEYLIANWIENAKLVEAHEKTKKGCYVSDVLPYLIVNTCCQFFFASTGIYFAFTHPHLLFSPCINCTHPFLKKYMLEYMFKYQIWNLMRTIPCNEYNDNLTIVHHSIAILISGLSLKYGIFQYQSIFFCGLFEFTSVILNLINILQLKSIWRTEYAGLLNILKLCFAISFLTIRTILMPIVCFLPIQTILFEYPYRVQKICILVAFIPLVLMQYYWGFKLIIKIHRTIKNETEEN
jgi:hypothetical protein